MTGPAPFSRGCQKNTPPRPQGCEHNECSGHMASHSSLHSSLREIQVSIIIVIRIIISSGSNTSSSSSSAQRKAEPPGSPSRRSSTQQQHRSPWLGYTCLANFTRSTRCSLELHNLSAIPAALPTNNSHCHNNSCCIDMATTHRGLVLRRLGGCCGVFCLHGLLAFQGLLHVRCGRLQLQRCLHTCTVP